MNNIEYYICENDIIMSGLIDKHGAGDNIKNFVKDGIVNPNVWFNLPPEKEKILFLLKESYESDKDIKRISDLTKWICKTKCTEVHNKKCGDHKKLNCKNCGADGKTFNPIAEWIYGINCISEGQEKEYDCYLGVEHRDFIKRRDELLNSVAIINLKKAEGRNGSNDDALYYAAAVDREELRRQTELINPTVIICGKTYGMLRCIYTDMEKDDERDNNEEKVSNINKSARMYKGRKIIATCHPSNPTSREAKYNDVMHLYKSLL